MGVVGRLDQYASMLAYEFDETTANGPSITGLGTYYASEFNENIVDIVRNGLVLNLDAGNLASYSGSGTTWTDLSGNSNNATLVNGPTYSSGNGGFIAFNGTNNYISFSSPLVFNTNSGFTIELMSYISSTQNNAQWSYFYSDGINSWEIGTYSTTPGSFEFKDNGGGGASVLCTLSSPWQHIVFGCDARQAFMYNNLSYSTNATLFRNANVSISNLNRSQSTSGGYFKTNQGIIRIYNRALTATEVAQNYNAIATRFNLATTNSTAPMLANVFAPYDLVYDEFGGTLFGAGQGRYMRQNTDKSVIVYNEIDEVSFMGELTPSTRSVDEGSTVTFNLTNSAPSTTLYWTLSTISGTINTSDFTGAAVSGSFSTNSSGIGSTSLTLANDGLVEGTESFQLQVRTGSISGTILATSATVTINDTSIITFTPGLAGKFFNGSWRSTIATGNIGTLPLTTTNDSSNVTGTTGLPSADHRFGVNLWPSIAYTTLGESYGFIAIGYFTPPTTGTYTIFTSSDDYSGVWIGDLALAGATRTSANATVNNGMNLGASGQANTKRSGTIALTGGVRYPIRIVMEEANGGDNLTFSWSGPGISETTDLLTYFSTPSSGGVLTGNY